MVTGGGGGGGGGGESTSVKLFSIFYMLNSKNRVFQPIFLNRYLSKEKNNFADNSSVEPAIFLMEKLSFSMKLFSGHFLYNPSLRLSEVLSMFSYTYPGSVKIACKIILKIFLKS